MLLSEKIKKIRKEKNEERTGSTLLLVHKNSEN